MATTEKRKEKSILNVTIYSELPTIEVIVYYVGWISGMFCMLYGVYVTSMENKNKNQHTAKGWSFIKPKRDVTDPTIEMAYRNISYIIFYGIVHYILAEGVKRTCIKVLPYYYIFFSLTVVIFHSSYNTGMVIVVQALLSCTVAYCGDIFYIWTWGLTAITTVYLPHENIATWCNLYDTQTVILTHILIWNSLRYLTFALDINKKREIKRITYKDFIKFLEYFFYFPTLCYGPLLLYEDFQKVYKLPIKESFYERTIKYIASTVKYTVYLYVTILLLHFLHLGLMYQLKHIHTSYSASHGFFWWAGFIFMLKHQIMYGLSISAAVAEGITAANVPKCIGRIALYSTMWKTFDQPMYRFKKRYIFEPFVNGSTSKVRQTIASLLCFLFVIVWHGGTPHIMVWAILNYMEVAVEELGRSFAKTKLFLKLYRNYLNPRYLRRIAALLSAPLFSLAIISQYVFLSDIDIVRHLWKKIMHTNYFVHGLVVLVVYSACQVSIETKMREDARKAIVHAKGD